MIVGIGIDLIQNSRISKSLIAHKLAFLKNVLTTEEFNKINKDKISTQHIAGIFAAKEAVIKSLSQYLDFSLNFQDIVIKKSLIGIPTAYIINEIVKNKLKKIKITISISHEKDYSIALSIAELQ